MWQSQGVEGRKERTKVVYAPLLVFKKEKYNLEDSKGG